MSSIHAYPSKGYTNGLNTPTHRDFECDGEACYPLYNDIVARRHPPIHNSYPDHSGEIYAERVIQKTTPYDINYDSYGIDHHDDHGSYGLNPRGYQVAERVETIIEHVHVPARTHMYPNHANAKLEPVIEYKVSEIRPLSPVYHDEYPKEGMSYLHNYQTKPTSTLLGMENRYNNVPHKRSSYEKPGQLSGTTTKIEKLVDFLKDASYARKY